MKMISIVIKLSHLFLIYNTALHALPIDTNISSVTNSTASSVGKAALAKLPLALPKFELPKKFNLSKIAQDLKEFGINSLKEDKHLEGLPLDRQGKANPDFHKEIFLGNHELFEKDIQHDEIKRNDKLKEIFKKADVNRNARLSKDELLNYVFKNVQDHLQEAKDKNTQLFVLIDTNQDGKVTWNEYFALYIKFHGVNASSLNASENFDYIHDPADINFQRELVKIRYRWTEADSSNDNELDVDEFLIFRHPEITGHSYKYVVDDIILQMDRNDDQKLTIKEFAFLPSSALEDDTNKEWVEMDKRWLEEQRREFHEMDIDADGILTREELLKAYDPMNRVHIDNQIKKLFGLVDDSPADQSLSLEEIQKHADVFTDMHILDTDKALHDEM